MDKTAARNSSKNKKQKKNQSSQNLSVPPLIIDNADNAGNVVQDSSVDIALGEENLSSAADNPALLSVAGRPRSRCGRQRRSLSRRKQEEEKQQELQPLPRKEEAYAPHENNNYNASSLLKNSDFAPPSQPPPSHKNSKRRNSRAQDALLGIKGRDASVSDDEEDERETRNATIELNNNDEKFPGNNSGTPPAVNNKNVSPSHLHATAATLSDEFFSPSRKNNNDFVADETRATATGGNDYDDFSSYTSNTSISNSSSQQQSFYTPTNSRSQSQEGLDDDELTFNDTSSNASPAIRFADVNELRPGALFLNSDSSAAAQSTFQPLSPLSTSSSDNNPQNQQQTNSPAKKNSSSPRRIFQSPSVDLSNLRGSGDYASALSTYESLASDQLRPVPIYPNPRIFEQETAALGIQSEEDDELFGHQAPQESKDSVDLTALGNESVIEIGGAEFNAHIAKQNSRNSSPKPAVESLDDDSGSFLDFLSAKPTTETTMSHTVHANESYADAIKVHHDGDAPLPEAHVDRVTADPNVRKTPNWSAKSVHLNSQMSFPAIGEPAVPLDELEEAETVTGVGAQEIKTPLDAAHVVELMHAEEEMSHAADERDTGKKATAPKSDNDEDYDAGDDDDFEEADDETESDDENSFRSRLAASARASGPGATPWVGATARPRPSFGAPADATTEKNTEANASAGQQKTASTTAAVNSTTRPQSILITGTKSDTTFPTSSNNNTPSSKSGVASTTSTSSVVFADNRESQQQGAGDSNRKVVITQINSPASQTAAKQPLPSALKKPATISATTTTSTVKTVSTPQPNKQPQNLYAGADTHGGVTRNVDQKITKVKQVETARSEPQLPPKDNTLIYVGIGVAVLAVGGIVCWRLMAASHK